MYAIPPGGDMLGRGSSVGKPQAQSRGKRVAPKRCRIDVCRDPPSGSPNRERGVYGSALRRCRIDVCRDPPSGSPKRERGVYGSH